MTINPKIQPRTKTVFRFAEYDFETLRDAQLSALRAMFSDLTPEAAARIVERKTDVIEILQAGGGQANEAPQAKDQPRQQRPAADLAIVYRASGWIATDHPGELKNSNNGKLKTTRRSVWNLMRAPMVPAEQPAPFPDLNLSH